jgi:NB-ARC domain
MIYFSSLFCIPITSQAMNKNQRTSLTDTGIEKVKSAIERESYKHLNKYKIYKDTSEYIYSNLKSFLRIELRFKISDETLKFILERIEGVRKSTIESLFGALSEPFSDNYIESFENHYKNRIKTSSNLSDYSCVKFVEPKDKMEEIKELIRTDKIHPYIITIKGSSGSGKTTLVTQIGIDIKDNITNNLAYESIVYIGLNKKYEFFQYNVDSLNLLQFDEINDIYRKISEVLGDKSIINLAKEDRKNKVYTALARKRTLLIIDDFHNLFSDQNQKQRIEITNFLACLPISTKVIITTQQSIGIGYEISLDSMPEIDVKNAVKEHSGVSNPEIIDQNIFAAILRTNLAIDNESEALSCVIGEGAIKCLLERTINKNIKNYLKDPIFDILIAAALFDFISYQSLIEISGISETPEIEILVSSTWVNSEILSKNSKDEYFMISSVKDIITEIISNEDYHEKIHKIFNNAYDMYKKITKENGGIDWGNWKKKYGVINYQWKNIKTLLFYYLSHNGYTQIKEIWNNVNHFADICGYYIDRLEWLEWLESKSRENGDWKEVSKCLSRSAWTLYMMGGAERQKKAIENLDNAIKITNKHFEKDALETSLHILNILHHYVKILLRDGRDQQALAKLKDQEKIIQAIDEKMLDAIEFKSFIRCKMNYLRDLAQYFKNTDENKMAREYYSQVLTLSTQNNWQRGLSLAANNLADIEINDNNLNEAEKYLFQALNIADFNQYERRQAHCNLSYAKLECKRGNKNKAAEYLDLAYDYYQRFDRNDKLQEIKKVRDEIKEIAEL